MCDQSMVFWVFTFIAFWYIGLGLINHYTGIGTVESIHHFFYQPFLVYEGCSKCGKNPN